MTQEWNELREKCLHCKNCSLWETRKNVVFGDGNPQSEIMLIGEGPGANEDELGLPFVGKAGQLLDNMLEIIHLDRTKVFITNIVKCRPPGNRDPLNVEQQACIGYLRRQTAMIRPKIIVCLGRISAMQIIDPEFKISRQHGEWFERGGVKMMAIYHPAALLRDPTRRPDAFDDLKKLEAEIKITCPNTYA